jgi:hypothetical protein
MIKKLLIPSDNNELEYVQTLKGKEILHQYKFTKSETKEGMLMTITDEQLNKNLKQKIFITEKI